MNPILHAIIILCAFCFIGFGLLMTLTINSWGKPCRDNDDWVE